MVKHDFCLFMSVDIVLIFSFCCVLSVFSTFSDLEVFTLDTIVFKIIPPLIPMLSRQQAGLFCKKLLDGLVLLYVSLILDQSVNENDARK